ncbi:hypothetical protein JTB14_028468 [Gonioctena quinquepunctata]|nr:hypothetical protein JTB14_028468 [Gonioctena quinquepunctata]
MSCSPCPHYFSLSLFPTESECPPTPTIQSISNEVTMVTQSEFGKAPESFLNLPQPRIEPRGSDPNIEKPPHNHSAPGGILEQEAHHIQGY